MQLVFQKRETVRRIVRNMGNERKGVRMAKVEREKERELEILKLQSGERESKRDKHEVQMQRLRIQ